MPKLIDLTNKQFTRLTVEKRVDNDAHGNPCWLCKCACGNYKVVQGGHLRSGAIKSCGCLRRKLNTVHGMRKIPEYKVWISIKTRCYNSNHQRYKDYGGRGIKVCDRWLNSFIAFFKDMGKRPGPKSTIERIDNDGDYKLSNCKWATRLEQANNRRLPYVCYMFKAISPINRVYTSKNQSEFARLFNLDCRNISACLNDKQRMHRGWIFERV